ncbi:MAG: sugar phosphate isomerase/epimerase family protein [Methanobacteriota archaeon]
MSKDWAIGCVEFAVPGATLEEKLEKLESRRMWLELTNDGGRKPEDISGTFSSFKTPIKSVQANLLHELKTLSDSETEHKAAVRHVEETMRLASTVGAGHVVTTLAYGKPAAKDPRELAIKTYKKFSVLAEELGVTVSIEPLGKNRSIFLPGTSEVYGLIREVDSAHVRLMADTMHIHDNGDDVHDVIAEYIDEISELQLRDTDSKPPGQGSIDFERVIKMVGKKFNGLLCLEYKPGPDPNEDFIQACDFANVISAAR